MLRRAFGPTAWLLDEVDEPAALARGILAAALAGVEDVIPAEATVLVRCRRAEWAQIGERLDSIGPLIGATDRSEVLEIEVVYDGDDLDTVALATGLSVEEVVARHQSAEYQVAFCGFSPGFGYLRGLDPLLHLPRRASPRTRVPAGAVAIAAGYSAVYPTASPGGWHLVGTTTAMLWDPRADQPAALWPGRRVRFRRFVP
jgi:KipI family sensor histidine kinase inhibitor